MVRCKHECSKFLMNCVFFVYHSGLTVLSRRTVRYDFLMFWTLFPYFPLVEKNLIRIKATMLNRTKPHRMNNSRLTSGRPIIVFKQTL